MGEEAAAPLLGDVHLNINLHGNRKEEVELLPATANRRWTLGWDWAEAAGQLAFAAPMVATSMAYYAIPLVSVMYAGRLGDLQLAAATLGNSWGTVTGIALLHQIIYIPCRTSHDPDAMAVTCRAAALGSGH